MEQEHRISVNFRQAMSQAEELERQAQSLRRLAETELDSIMSGVAGNWSGENAQAWQRKCSALRGKILATSRSLNRKATMMKTVAQTFYRTEMEAVRIAREREL